MKVTLHQPLVQGSEFRGLGSAAAMGESLVAEGGQATVEDSLVRQRLHRNCLQQSRSMACWSSLARKGMTLTLPAP